MSLMMDTAFYDEQTYAPRAGRDVNLMKRCMTLDLSGPSKRPKLNSSLNAAPVLSSPDLCMLKLESPELEKLIIENQNLTTATPTPTTQILFPRHVTEEQENYAQGFVEALNELHHSGDSSQGNNSQLERSGSSDNSNSSGGKGTSGGPTYMSLDASHYPPITVATSHGFVMTSVDAIVKEEPQTVPNISSPHSPIDMEDQERIKLERKRQRNRLAASKCRRRKLERIAKLEEKVKLLKTENTELTGVVNKLKEQVYNLKEQVMDHVQSGCQIMVVSNMAGFS